MNADSEVKQEKRIRSVAVYSVVVSLLLLGLLLLWGIFGKIPRKISGEGILINGGGSVIVYAPVDGIVSDVSVYQDMNVNKNDTLARIETSDGSIVKVAAPDNGRVIALEIIENKPVRAGSEIGRILIKTDNADLLEVVCYISLSDAGKVIPGMEMEVYPVGINTDETGCLNALVSESSTYPSIKTDMVYDIGSDAIAESFLKKSPIVTVKGALLKSLDSANSYSWSNPKGGRVRITDGMLIEATVVVGYESPFTLIMPFFKGILFGESE